MVKIQIKISLLTFIARGFCAIFGPEHSFTTPTDLNEIWQASRPEQSIKACQISSGSVKTQASYRVSRG